MNTDNVDNPLDSNKSFGAQARDFERALVRERIEPVDLRTITHAQWASFENRHLVLPPGVKAFLDGHDGTPLSSETVHGLVEAIEAFHGVAPPFTVFMELHTQQTGRGWVHEPDAAPFLTGFLLDTL